MQAQMLAPAAVLVVVVADRNAVLDGGSRLSGDEASMVAGLGQGEAGGRGQDLEGVHRRPRSTG